MRHRTRPPLSLLLVGFLIVIAVSVVVQAPARAASNGACCFEDCSCFILPEEECLPSGGYWLGPDTVCDPNPCECPAGACCFPDGSCQYLTEPECLDNNGLFIGWGSCEPNPCPQPNGACCLPDGTCVVLEEWECQESGGVYIGDEIPCEPYPCAIHSLNGSWGKIKSRYRGD